MNEVQRFNYEVLRAKRPRVKQRTVEHDHQVALIRWAGLMAESELPDLQWLFAVPNGGARYVRTARRLKEEGVRAGVPDLCLPVPRGIWHGLYIEMKAPKMKGRSLNKPTNDQRRWLEGLRSFNYRAEVCYGWPEAAELLEGYLRTWE